MKGFNLPRLVKFGLLLSLILLSSSLRSDVNPQDYVYPSQNWNSSMYSEFDYEAFYDYVPANNQLDFNNIDYELLAAAIFYETNKQRVNATSRSPYSGGNPLNLFPFEYCHDCKVAAQMHAEDMVEGNFFSHNNPRDNSKRTISDRIHLFDFYPHKWGENIATSFGIAYEAGSSIFPPDQTGGPFYTYPDRELILPHTYISFAQAVLNQWMHSAGHRRNILDSGYTHLGTGAKMFADNSFYGMIKFQCVQVFADVAD